MANPATKAEVIQQDCDEYVERMTRHIHGFVGIRIDGEQAIGIYEALNRAIVEQMKIVCKNEDEFDYFEANI